MAGTGQAAEELGTPTSRGPCFLTCEMFWGPAPLFFYFTRNSWRGLGRQERHFKLVLATDTQGELPGGICGANTFEVRMVSDLLMGPASLVPQNILRGHPLHMRLKTLN